MDFNEIFKYIKNNKNDFKIKLSKLFIMESSYEGHNISIFSNSFGGFYLRISSVSNGYYLFNFKNNIIYILNRNDDEIGLPDCTDNDVWFNFNIQHGCVKEQFYPEIDGLYKIVFDLYNDYIKMCLSRKYGDLI